MPDSRPMLRQKEMEWLQRNLKLIEEIRKVLKVSARTAGCDFEGFGLHAYSPI